MRYAVNSSPPTAWLITFFLVLPIPLPLIYPIMMVDPGEFEGANEFVYRQQVAQFLERGRSGDNRSRGVMLAMSGGSCATVGPHMLSANGAEMHVVFYPEASPESFHGLIEVLVDGKPDFVVIQDTVLVRSQSSRAATALLSYNSARSYWRGQFAGLARKLNGHEFGLADSDNWRCPWPSQPQSSWPELVNRYVEQISPYSEARNVQVVEFIRRLSAIETPVVIVAPPANKFTSKYRRQVFQAASAMADASPPLPNVSFHRQPQLMPTELFINPFHLSRESSQSYRTWLNNVVTGVLQVRENH